MSEGLFRNISQFVTGLEKANDHEL